MTCIRLTARVSNAKSVIHVLYIKAVNLQLGEFLSQVRILLGTWTFLKLSYACGIISSLSQCLLYFFALKD